jgi:hypothetical protein
MVDQRLFEVLRQVQRGATSFEPESNSSESVQRFQELAGALVHAERCGYIGRLVPMKDSWNGALVYRAVRVIDGLTHEGRLVLDESANFSTHAGVHLNLNLLNNEAWRGPLMLAIQKAILAGDLDTADWRELGFQTGTQDYVSQHPRLLRSLAWGDSDYGDCVFQALMRVTQRNPSALTFFIQHPKLFPALERDAQTQLVQLGYGVTSVAAVPAPATASEAVRRAISDADYLLSTSGPVSTIDRLHTALHGYLRSLCDRQGIELPGGSSITSAYKLLRKEHPKLQSLGEHEGETSKILASLASVVDAVNTLRNNGSVAHPNEKLLGQAEGMLVVNTVRTLFHYLSSKLP